jgi:hypothetical protein
VIIHITSIERQLPLPDATISSAAARPRSQITARACRSNLSETVTVSETSPLVQTTSTAQSQTIGNEVREIPVSRRNLQNTSCWQATRNRILTALPFPETKIELDAMPLSNAPLDDVVGQYTDAKRLIRRDNTLLAKVDLEVGSGRLSVTTSRMRPYAQNPAAEIGNDTIFVNGSKRLATQYVLTSGSWVSESRFGWNRNTLDRSQQLWFMPSPTRGPQDEFINVRKRIGNFGVFGLFTTPPTEVLDMDYDAFNVDQKISRLIGAHHFKIGFRYFREYGSKSNPQANQFRYQTLDDLLANRPNSFLLSMGNPPHKAWLDQLGGFIQDDWRVNPRLMINLGLRYDYYPSFH